VLLKAGADMEAKDDRGRTPLHWACLNGRIPIVRLLLEKGAEANVRDTENHAPLDLASGPENPAREEILDLFREYAPEAVMEAYCTQSPQS